MPKTRWMIVTILGAMLFAGCASGPDDWVDTAPIDDTWGGVQSSLVVEAREHRGTMGAVQGFDGDVVMTSGSTDANYTFIEVHSANDGWATMSQLFIDGALADLEPGTTLTFAGYEDWTGEAVHISMVGCSGPEQYAWDYDVPVEDLEVDVMPGETPEGRVLHFRGTSPSGDVVEGEVAVEPY